MEGSSCPSRTRPRSARLPPLRLRPSTPHRGSALPQGEPTAAPDGGWRARQDRLYTTEGGWLHLDKGALVEDAVRARESGFAGAKLKIGRPVHEDVDRLQAVRTKVGQAFEIFTDANQAFNVDGDTPRSPVRSARHRVAGGAPDC